MGKTHKICANKQFENYLQLLLLQYSLDCIEKNFNEESFSKKNEELIRKIRSLLEQNEQDIQYTNIICDLSTRYTPFPNQYIYKWINKQNIQEHNEPKNYSGLKFSYDSLIYHYTSESMLSVFLKKNSSFCVTHWNFLNDSKELFAYVRKFDLCDKAPCNIPFFLMSFSLLKDDLNLWRAYAQNGGYALGFCKKDLESAFLDTVFLRECIYSCDEIVSKVPHKNAFCFYKDPAFSSEKEVRLLFECTAKERIEIIGNKPRIRLKFSDGKTILSLLKEIIIAPNGNVEYNFSMAKMLCYMYGISPKIIKSKLPFRNW